jgi:DNA invertase Pin-like site-specific DNA recombinase
MDAVKVIGYVRVSRVGGREDDDKKDRFISPALQRESVERLAEREGLRVVEWVEELDASGGDATRPGWNGAIEAVEAGRVQGIAVWNLSRFSRSLKDATSALERIERAGGRVYSATEQWGDGAMGRFTRDLYVNLAQMERERAAEGFRAAGRSAAERGIHVAGRVPLGYRRGPDRRLEPDPETVPIVQGVFERKARGWSHEALARWVHEQGVEGFSSTGVRWMLSNRVYLGEARGGGAVVEGAHPALVSRALFARCQGRGVQSQRAGRLAGRYLLQGVARCAGCGRGLRLSTSGKGRAFYRCRTTGCAARGYAGADALDAYVLNSIEEQLTGLNYDGERVGPGVSDEAHRAATLVPTLGDEAEVEEARLALEEARAELDEWLNDTELRRAVGPAKHTEAAASYAAVVAKCEADLEAARARHTGGWGLVGRLWNTEWGHAERREWVARVVREVIVSKGREPLSERVEVELR